MDEFFWVIEKAPYLTVSVLVIWTLPSDTVYSICQTQSKYHHILRRQCCLGFHSFKLFTDSSSNASAEQSSLILLASLASVEHIGGVIRRTMGVKPDKKAHKNGPSYSNLNSVINLFNLTLSLIGIVREKFRQLSHILDLRCGRVGCLSRKSYVGLKSHSYKNYH